MNGSLKKENLRKLDGTTVNSNPTQTGWTRKVTFSLWEKGGNSRLYAKYVDFDRQGRMRNHDQLAGYVDVNAGEVIGKNRHMYDALEAAGIKF